MNKGEVFFDNYNSVIARCRDEYAEWMEMNADRDDVDLYEEKFNQKEKDSIKDWENTPVGELDNITPTQFINSIESFQEAVSLFKSGSEIVDENLPWIFICKLRTFGDKAVDFLIQTAFDDSLINSDDHLMIPLMAIRVLGQWQEDKAVEPLIHNLFRLDESNALFIEEIRDALVCIGNPSVDPIIRKLEQDSQISIFHEYLLMALTDIGEKDKSDNIFRCIKNTFSKSDNKLTGIICLGNYGDGRAVTALRGFLLRNIENIDRITLYETKHAVEKLGGSVDDIISGTVR